MTYLLQTMTNSRVPATEYIAVDAKRRVGSYKELSGALILAAAQGKEIGKRIGYRIDEYMDAEKDGND